jgi:hypothetical protein
MDKDGFLAGSEVPVVTSWAVTLARRLKKSSIMGQDNAQDNTQEIARRAHQAPSWPLRRTLPSQHR